MKFNLISKNLIKRIENDVECGRQTKREATVYAGQIHQHILGPSQENSLNRKWIKMRRMATREEELKGQDGDNLAPGFVVSLTSSLPALLLYSTKVFPQHRERKGCQKRIAAWPLVFAFIHFLNMHIFLLYSMGGKRFFFPCKIACVRLWPSEIQKQLLNNLHRHWVFGLHLSILWLHSQAISTCLLPLQSPTPTQSLCWPM